MNQQTGSGLLNYGKLWGKSHSCVGGDKKKRVKKKKVDNPRLVESTQELIKGSLRQLAGNRIIEAIKKREVNVKQGQQWRISSTSESRRLMKKM